MATDNHGAASAPADILWCPKCRSALETREIGGKPRRACPACRYIHFLEAKVGVGVCVIEAGRVLLVRRRFNPEKGKWSIPAGYLDYGEEPQAHAIQEVFEETGLDVAIDRYPTSRYSLVELRPVTGRRHQLRRQ